MTKVFVRMLKSHYLSRWAVLRHNQKRREKILLFADQFILKNLLPGNTLVHDCLGDMYKDIIANLSLKPEPGVKYQNLVLVNNIEFKYKTTDQLSEYIENLAAQTLTEQGRIILSFEHRFLIYNRIEVSVDSMLNDLLLSFKRSKLKQIINLIGRSPPGYGDYFICLDYK